MNNASTEPVRESTYRAANDRDNKGRFVKLYTLSYTKKDYVNEVVRYHRVLPHKRVMLIGKLINKWGNEGRAWDIEVTRKGEDVTHEFDCFD